MGVGYNPRIVTNGLIAYWDAENPKSYPGSGTTWTDLSKNGNTGTLQATPTFNSSGYFTLNGTTQYISTTTSYVNPQIFSVCAWFRTSSASGHKIVGLEDVQTGTSGTSYDRHLYMGTDGKIYFGASGASYTSVATSSSTYTDNKWHYAVGTYGGEGTTARLYMDGVSISTASIASAPQNYTGYYRIGSYKLNLWAAATDGYFGGDIATVMIYNIGLTSSQVAQNYYAMRGRFGL